MRFERFEFKKRRINTLDLKDLKDPGPIGSHRVRSEALEDAEAILLKEPGHPKARYRRHRLFFEAQHVVTLSIK